MNHNKPYKKLIFDADNTLFDFNRAEATALVNTLNHFELPCPEGMVSHYRQMNVALWAQLDNKEIDIKTLKHKRTAAIFDHIGAAVDEAAFAHQYLDQLSSCDFLLPGVSETLDQLSEHCDMMIITNGLSQVQQPRLKASSIKDHFKHWVISEEFGHAKPQKEIFHHSCELMGWTPNKDILMVGDNYRCDVQGAKASGLSACWFNLFKLNLGQKKTDFTDHDHEIRQFSELLDLTVFS
ncbi:YjjG family noncanonical pyrimidine nucleotidase [Marinicella rhabdoformis]|uniref:YjjG family noncanonical pyrimidine nucleotidase n=1 Tax=Marinicella rhabdoformis TaxID=2580566 RepID=UPI0012AEBB11|nr:YjjG family noncanonical pyrimidine nucleotidase [Marinicella rhabdoformis]